MVKLSVSGKIIEEISHNIPGTKYAIIELIKNSYEAGASFVTIDVSPQNIIITDNGKGMNSKEIETLLTVSSSNKIFGQEINGRLISGEKGLGFFSAFKFGNKINISTSKNGTNSIFQLNMREIAAQNNLYHFDIPITEHNIDSNQRGTVITISELYSETFSLFKETLDNEADFMRLLHVIEDSDFNITINKSWEKGLISAYSNKNLNKAKLATALFDSISMINFNNKENPYFFKLVRNCKEYTFPIDKKYEKLFKIENFSLRVHIDIFNLKGLSRKDISPIYHDLSRKRITPVIYINNCLFDNYTMYNPEINAAMTNTYVFRQQTGKIEIFLRSPGIISFNSDRTQMTESLNSKLFQQFLNYFSSEIQKSLRNILNKEEGKAKESNHPSNVNGMLNLENNKNASDSNYQNDVNSNESEKQKFTDTTVEKPDPIIRQIEKKFIVGREYSFDELFTFKDCEEGDKIRPLSFTVEPADCRSLNLSKERITFNKPCSKIIFEISIQDKISKKIISAEHIGQSVFPFSNESNESNLSVPVIHPLMEIEQNIKSDVIQFKNQLNDLYRNGPQYEIVFISALRTFVELLINDIVEKLGYTNHKELQENYKLINKNENIKEQFINKIKNDREKAGIETIYKQALKEGRYASTVQYLNLTTHAAGRIITLKQIESDFPIINLIYTYLCFVSK